MKTNHPTLVATQMVLSMFISLSVISLSGCAGTFQHTLDVDPAEPLRVAILPFVQLDSSSAIVEPGSEESKKSLLIDNVPLVSSELAEAPEVLVRKHVFRQLSSQSGFDLVPPPIVDAQLQHHGLVKGVEPDVARIYSMKPAELCQILGCDALLYGKITKWDRSFYAVESVHDVGLEFTLISAQSGKTLFSSKAEDAERRGISKGPTGWTSLALEPIKGLDSAITQELSFRITDTSLKPLYLKSRPEYLQASPPAILGSAYVTEGLALTKNGSLTVFAVGSPGSVVSFSLGNAIQNIPMEERGKGHYIGEYYPLATDSFSNQAIFVLFLDKYGRTARQEVGMEKVSLH